jgi:hypothetical protein
MEWKVLQAVIFAPAFKMCFVQRGSRNLGDVALLCTPFYLYYLAAALSINAPPVCLSAASKSRSMSSDPPASGPPALPALLTAAEGDEQRGEKVPSATSRPKQPNGMPAIQVL